MTPTADSKKRIVLPTACPGDVFDIQRRGDGLFVLVRLERPEPEMKLTRKRCLQAIAAAPLHPKLFYQERRARVRVTLLAGSRHQRDASSGRIS